MEQEDDHYNYAGDPCASTPYSWLYTRRISEANGGMGKVQQQQTYYASSGSSGGTLHVNNQNTLGTTSSSNSSSGYYNTSSTNSSNTYYNSNTPNSYHPTSPVATRNKRSNSNDSSFRYSGKHSQSTSQSTLYSVNATANMKARTPSASSSLSLAPTPTLNNLNVNSGYPYSSQFQVPSSSTSTSFTHLKDSQQLPPPPTPVNALHNPLPSPLISSSYETLNELVQKRITTFAYLKRAHEGRVHWFNTILIQKDHLERKYSYAIMRRRTASFFMLGISLPQILDISVMGDFLKALLLLMQEYEYQTSEQTKPKMKMLFRNQYRTPVRKLNDFSFSDSGDYSYLIVPNTPFDLDYFQTFYTLCDILVEVYSKFLIGSNQCSPTVLETVVKIDSKFKKIISIITKELDSLARETIKDELQALDPLLSFANGDNGLYM